MFFDRIEPKDGDIVFNNIILQTSLINFYNLYAREEGGQIRMPVIVSGDELGLAGED